MKCEHDTRTLELPGLGELAKPASAQPVMAGRGPYRTRYATQWARRRQALGLTMKALASLANVSLRTLERYEAMDPVSEKAKRSIRDALDCAEISPDRARRYAEAKQ